MVLIGSDAASGSRLSDSVIRFFSQISLTLLSLSQKNLIFDKLNPNSN